jgi:hypothetical protein
MAVDEAAVERIVKAHVHVAARWSSSRRPALAGGLTVKGATQAADPLTQGIGK